MGNKLTIGIGTQLDKSSLDRTTQQMSAELNKISVKTQTGMGMGTEFISKSMNKSMSNIEMILKDIKKNTERMATGVSPREVGKGKAGASPVTDALGMGGLSNMLTTALTGPIGAMAATIMGVGFAGKMIAKMGESYRGEAVRQIGAGRAMGFMGGPLKGGYWAGAPQYGISPEQQSGFIQRYNEMATGRYIEGANAQKSEASRQFGQAKIAALISGVTGINQEELGGFMGVTRRFGKTEATPDMSILIERQKKVQDELSFLQYAKPESFGLNLMGSKDNWKKKIETKQKESNVINEEMFRKSTEGKYALQTIGMGMNVGMTAGRSKEFFDAIKNATMNGIESGMKIDPTGILNTFGALYSTKNEQLKFLAPQMFEGGQQMFGQAARLEGGASSAFTMQALKSAHPEMSLLELQRQAAIGMNDPNNLKAVMKLVDTYSGGNETTKANMLMQLDMFKMIKNPFDALEMQKEIQAFDPSKYKPEEQDKKFKEIYDKYFKKETGLTEGREAAESLQKLNDASRIGAKGLTIFNDVMVKLLTDENIINALGMDKKSLKSYLSDLLGK